MDRAQKGILEGVPPHSRHVFYDLLSDVDAKDALEELAGLDVGAELLLGLGPSLVWAAGGAIEGLHAHPPMVGPGVAIPSTPYSLFAWHRGADRGDLVLAARQLEEDLEDFFEINAVIDGFRHREGRDLTGYPEGDDVADKEEAATVALVAGRGGGLDASSFVAVQRWEHDLDDFFELEEDERDLLYGIRIDDDSMIEDAPDSAHVKRIAPATFTPPAHLVRRSMPWADEDGEGLMTLAFGASFDPVEAQLRRMVGLDDGIVDAIFTFTRPTAGAYFWCPPVQDGALDLRTLGVAD